MKVIVICGASGSGKTSSVKNLATKFACPYLLFDEYLDADTYPQDIKQWFLEGGDLAQITTPRLVSALTAFTKQNEYPFIFVEEPFGRCRTAIAPLVDEVVLLDMPLEICLSRVIMRNINNSPSKSHIMIANYLARYDDHLRAIYREMVERARQSSDLIVQDLGSVEHLAELICEWLTNHYGCKAIWTDWANAKCSSRLGLL
ncbi:hypothetical protein ACFOEE_09650 [Pseudoalteromonas fenneropenaei]|uniref:Uridine kinase n=1 Tax=Pseudoalteromonas fenneropenaei TaxID=1737459 RepID=A0ABV7CJN6_9GAMM